MPAIPASKHDRSHELRVVLDERIGGPGQFGGGSDDPHKFYLPLAGPSCQVMVTYRGSEIVAVERGPALTAEEWELLSKEIENSLVAGPEKVGRDFSFNTHRVLGYWQGTRSGVQILPPPDDAPRAPVETADHPFILEFPIRESDIWPLTNHRRVREHRCLTLLLNVLLKGTTSHLPRRLDHFWAAVPPDDEHSHGTNIKWVQQFFIANLGQVVIEKLSRPTGPRLEELEPGAYYATVGHDGQGMRVPADLDDSIYLYQQLDDTNRAKFNRATFWLDIASRLWTISVSSSFASLVSSVESLTEKGTSHAVYCDQCQRHRQHDVPGAVEKFRAFFEHYAPGAELINRRSKIYQLRSGILHGGELMQVDQDRAFGWDPPEWNERELHGELWNLTKVALRNWLRNPPEP